LSRIAVGIVAAAVALLALVLVLGARDNAEVGTAQGPGELRPDRGASHDAPAGRSGSEPPTSGTHRPVLVTRDRRPLTDDQLIHALELGNVVFLYDGPDPGTVLMGIQREVAGPFDAALAAAGQAIILAPRSGAGPATALAWRRLLKTDDPYDSRLREFAEAWLASGAPRNGAQ
jgi:Protein of unknown function (DUF3105)